MWPRGFSRFPLSLSLRRSVVSHEYKFNTRVVPSAIPFDPFDPVKLFAVSAVNENVPIACTSFSLIRSVSLTTRRDNLNRKKFGLKHEGRTRMIKKKFKSE